MKKSLLALAIATACASAVAAEPAATLERLAACSAIADRDQRLACFDREIAPVARGRTTPPAAPTAQRSNPAPTPQPRAQTAPAPAAPPVASAPPAAPQKSFGEEQLDPKRRATQPAEEDLTLHARITELRKIGASAFAVTLDNGQVWRHEDGHLGSYLREGEAVTLRKGTLGSYRLTRDEGASRDWIRVTRVR